MTLGQIIERTRQIVYDTKPPYRWSPYDMRQNVILAVRRLNAKAPQTRYVGGALADGTSVPVEETGELALDDRYLEALAFYVGWLCYQGDATDTMNAERAATCLQRAESMMV